MIESSLGVVAACLPSMRPIFSKIAVRVQPVLQRFSRRNIRSSNPLQMEDMETTKAVVTKTDSVEREYQAAEIV